MNIIIWITQGLLSIAFLVAGLMKITLPKDKLRGKIGDWVDDYKATPIKLVGLTEVLGALGLILPMIFNILPVLTPIAACGLVLSMIGAVQIHLRRKEIIDANVVLLIMAGFVAIGRFYIVPVI
jgi:uncharacterized membrane protein